MILMIIWLLILGSGWIAFAALVSTVFGGKPRDVIRERSRSIMLFLCSVSLMCICVSFLALSDIRKDYAGYKLEVDGTPIQSMLPDWARCQLEWSIIIPSVVTIAISQLIMVVILMIQHNVVKEVLRSPADQTRDTRSSA